MNRLFAISLAFLTGTSAWPSLLSCWLLVFLCTAELENPIPPLLAPINLRCRSGCSFPSSRSVASSSKSPVLSGCPGGGVCNGVLSSMISSSCFLRTSFRRFEGRNSDSWASACASDMVLYSLNRGLHWLNTESCARGERHFMHVITPSLSGRPNAIPRPLLLSPCLSI